MFKSVENQLETAAADHEALKRYAAVASKIALLEDEYHESKLEESEEYRALRDEAERLRDRLEAEISDLDERLASIRDVDRGSA
ncbi:MAG: HalX domain-containing protein [Haloferacaceae archaeon]